MTEARVQGMLSSMGTETSHTERRAWVLFGIVAAIFTVGLAGYAFNWGPVEATDWGVGGHAPDILFRVAMFLFPVTGALVASRQPRNAVGWILLSVGLGWSLYWLMKEYWRYALVTEPGALPRPDLVLALSSLTWLPAVGLMGTFLLLLFPDGALPSSRWKVMARISAVTLVLIPLVATFQTKNFSDEGFPAVQNPLRIEALAPLLDALEPMILLIPLCFIGCAAGLIVRFRRARGLERLQLKWFAAGAGALALLYLAAMAISFPFWAKEDSSLPFAVSVLQEVATFSFALIPVAAGIAILRYRLYDIDVIINRSLVYGTLTLLVVGMYAAVVLIFERALTERISLGPSLFATAVVAIGFAPARERVQSRVDRFLYGARRDPYRAVSALATRLEASLALDEVLPAVVENVATALRLPWAELRIHAGESESVWRHGDKTEPEMLFPLHYRGEWIGELAVGPRRGETDLDRSDRRLLEHLAAQAGAAAHAVSLTQALQRSRERLVTTREEERRRLRRDLHDGLGPELTSVAMKIDLIRRTVEKDPSRADDLLEELRGRVKASIDDIRRLVYDLRPPALDELGLVGALRQQATNFSGNGSGLSVKVEAADDLPELPAATEVAAFRIAAEAVNNSARHSGATSCEVRITMDTDLVVEVIDDGRWKDNPVGVGINSMRERASELGGTCEIGQSEQGGAKVLARLPVKGS